MKNPWVALVVLVLVGVLFTAPWALAQNSSASETNPNLSAISGSFTGPVATAGTMSAALFDGGNFRGVNADFTGTLGVGGTSTFGGLMNADTVDAGTLICQGDTTLKGTASTGGMVTVGTNAINQLELSGSAGTPTVRVNGPGADIGLALQAKGTGAVRVDSPYPFAVDSPATFGDLVNAAEVDAGALICQGNSTLKGTLGVAGTATFAGTVNASTVDAGVEVISPKHCVGGTCGVNFTLSGATAVCNSTFQAPTVTCTGFCQSLGGFGNTGGAGDCVGALSSMCVNDPQGLAVSNGSVTTITMATDGGGSAIFSGSLSTPLTDAGVLQLRTTTGNPTCGIGDAGLNDPNAGQHRFQPSTATEGVNYFCSGRGWIPYPTPSAFGASFGSSPSITEFGGTPPLVSPSGTPGPGGQLSGCAITIETAGSGGAGVTFNPEWHDGDGGTPVRLCQIDLSCTSTPGRYQKIDCGGGGEWGPRFGGTGYIDLGRSTDGGACGTFPSGFMSCSYAFLLPTLPL